MDRDSGKSEELLARNWKKFKLDELTHLWMRHKEKGPNSLAGTVNHSLVEIKGDEKEELIDYLLKKLWEIKEKVDEAY